MTMQPAWPCVPLGELVRAIRPRVDPRQGPGLQFVGMENVSSRTMRLLGTVPAATMKSAAIRFEAGDVLYGRLRPYLNKVYQASFRGLSSAEFIVMTPSDRLDGTYLAYLLSSADFVRFATSLNTGDRPRVDFQQISDYPVPLPDLATQRAVVRRLDAALTMLEAGEESMGRARSRIGSCVRAAMENAVAGRLTAGAKNWRQARLEDVLASIRNGMPQKPDADSGGIPILRISAVRPLSVDLSDVRYMNAKHVVSEDYFLREGDLLFTRYNGNPELVGVCGMVRGLTAALLHPDKLIRAVVRSDVALPAYVMIAANAGPTRAFIRERTRTTAGQSGISGGDLRQAPIPLPPLSEQVEIVRQVETYRSIAQEARRLIDINLGRSHGLRETILATWFNARVRAPARDERGQ